VVMVIFCSCCSGTDNETRGIKISVQRACSISCVHARGNAHGSAPTRRTPEEQRGQTGERNRVNFSEYLGVRTMLEVYLTCWGVG
jgi:hypothetical protein